MVEPILKSPQFTEATKSLKPPEARPAAQQSAEPSRRMASFDIIKQVLSKELGGGQAKSFMNSLTTNMQKGVTKLMQIGNTVFVVNFMTKDGKLMPPKTVEFYPITVEPDQIVERLRVFPNMLKELGFVGAISYIDDPNDMRELQAAGVPLTVKEEMVFDGEQMSPMYRVEMRLA